MLLRLKARGVEKEPGVYEITSLPTVEWQFFPNTKKLIVNGKEYEVKRKGQLAGWLVQLVLRDQKDVFETMGVFEALDVSNGVWHRLDKNIKVKIRAIRSYGFITPFKRVMVRLGEAVAYRRKFKCVFDNKKFFASDRIDPFEAVAAFCGGDPSDYIFLFGYLFIPSLARRHSLEPWDFTNWILVRRNSDVIYDGIKLVERDGKIWVEYGDIKDEFIGPLYNHIGEPSLVTKQYVFEHVYPTKSWRIVSFQSPVVGIQQIGDFLGVVFLEDGCLYAPHDTGELLPRQDKYVIGDKTYYRIGNSLVEADGFPQTIARAIEDFS